MRVDPYDRFAERYDVMKTANPNREEFFRVLLTGNGVRSILDCACGTGQDLLMFHSFGCDVCGSDVSDSMLSQARKKLTENGLDIPVRKADFRDLSEQSERKFDAVVCLGNSINELLEEDEVVRALRSMKSVLREGGMIIIDQGQSDASMKNPPGFAPIVNDRDHSRLFVIDYFEDQMEIHVFDFTHTETDTDFSHSRFRLSIRLQADWERILSKAGLSRANFYGSWIPEPYNKENSSRLIIVARA